MLQTLFTSPRHPDMIPIYFRIKISRVSLPTRTICRPRTTTCSISKPSVLSFFKTLKVSTCSPELTPFLVSRHVRNTPAPLLIQKTFTQEVAAMASSSAEKEPEHGFDRPEMYKEALAGTVHHYEKHVVLCYKDPQSWPSNIETSQEDELPRLFADSLKARKSDTPRKTRLTIADATESSDGDVLIFPDMVKYKGLTTSDIEKFVEEVLVNGSNFFSERKETLQGSHVFVCAHARRDMRCGVCGPVLIDCFKKEIADRGIADGVFVRSSSHVGGHKYAGNVIIYCSQANGEVAGHWYGYVTPKDVPVLLDEHIGKGKIINKLWRGQMGLSEEEQKKAHQQCLEASQSTEGPRESCPCSQVKEEANGPTTGCCKNRTEGVEKKKSGGCWSRCVSCFDSWEKGDTLAALAVVAAVASVAVAFNLSRISS